MSEGSRARRRSSAASVRHRAHHHEGSTAVEDEVARAEHTPLGQPAHDVVCGCAGPTCSRWMRVSSTQTSRRLSNVTNGGAISRSPHSTPGNASCDTCPDSRTSCRQSSCPMIGGWQQVVAVRVVAVVVRVDQGAERSIGDRADGVEKSAGPLLREARRWPSRRGRRRGSRSSAPAAIELDVGEGPLGDLLGGRRRGRRCGRDRGGRPAPSPTCVPRPRRPRPPTASPGTSRLWSVARPLRDGDRAHGVPGSTCWATSSPSMT